MIFYAKITKEADVYNVDFPELKGCFTESSSLEQALLYAEEALNGWIAARCDHNLDIPEPKQRRACYYYPIEVDLRIAFSVMLRRARAERGLSQAQVAKRLGISQQAYAKLETPQKANPSLSTIQKISKALDVELYFQLVA